MTQKRTRRAHPVSSFGPELLEALVRGGERELIIELPEVRNATYMVQRLYELRKRMREEEHPQWELVSRCRISNVRTIDGKPVKTNIVRIRPYDAEFRHALDRALDSAGFPGMKEITEVKGIPSDSPPDPPSDTPSGAFDSFLANLAKE